MEADRWRAVEALFLQLADAEPAKRATALAAEEARDPELAAEVRKLLAGDEGSDEPFEAFRSATWLPREDSLVGRQIGPYHLTALLGSGGMGVVYRARRTDGLFERDVAVKLIRAERMSDTAVRRFESERRALAALNHPNIARLYDGGTTPEGTPWLVMELVEGDPVDRWCDHRSLPIDARLRLFATICRAVHVAHQSLVVHRDIKPSNLIVDEQRVPKLLDFGIARLLDEVEIGVATETLARVLTPAYASPEQFTSGAVTTAMDIYSLGVVLYELLAGRKPFEAHTGIAPVEWQRRVLELAPERPSVAALRRWEDAPSSSSEIAARRSTTPSALRRKLEGDLDRIVLMALRKEPDRRYASALALAEDLERHLAGQPVNARGDSLAYRTSKFVRRNRIAVAAALLVLLAGASAFVATLRSERLTRQEAQHARIEAESFEGIAEFVMDTFLTSDFAGDEARVAAALERVRLHVERVRLQHADAPHLRANLLDALGKVCLRLGLYDEALALVSEARAIRAATFGERSLEYALSLRSAGLIAHSRGLVPEAERLFGEALALHRALPAGTHTDVATAANDLAVCLRGRGDLAGAELLHREALALRRSGGRDSLSVAESLNNLALVHLDRAESELAREALEEALAIRRAVLTDHHPLTLQSMANLASPAWQAGQRAEALELLGEAAAGQRRLGEAGREGLGRTLSNLAGMQILSGDLDAAESSLAEALAIERAHLGPEHPALAGSWAKLAELQQRRGHPAEARASWQRVLSLRRASGSPRGISDALFGYGRFLAVSGSLAEALGAFAEAVETLRAEPTAEPLALGRAELTLGACLARLARPAEAEPHLRQAAALLRDVPAAQGELREAERLLAEIASGSR